MKAHRIHLGSSLCQGDDDGYMSLHGCVVQCGEAERIHLVSTDVNGRQHARLLYRVHSRWVMVHQQLYCHGVAMSSSVVQWCLTAVVGLVAIHKHTLAWLSYRVDPCSRL